MNKLAINTYHKAEEIKTVDIPLLMGEYFSDKKVGDIEYCTITCKDGTKAAIVTDISAIHMDTLLDALEGRENIRDLGDLLSSKFGIQPPEHGDFGICFSIPPKELAKIKWA